MTSDKRKPSIFISHAHRDFRLAKAMRRALLACFEREVDIGVSSEDGAIPGGDNWVAWIHDQVSTCDMAVVLLTQTSIQNPWVLYETGGIDGVARISPESDKKLVPVSFLRQSSELPEPFKARVANSGTDKDKFVIFLRETINRFRNRVKSDVVDEARERLRDTAAVFIEEARDALLHTPVERSEALIQEWCDRIDEMVSARKLQEATSLRRMIGIAFYGEADKRGKALRADERFLDFRLHRRFGELFFDLKRYKEAAEEYRMALDVAPRDVYLLHRLGLTLVRDKAFDDAKDILKTIDLVDADITSESEEIASLRARFFKDQGLLPEAIAALRAYKYRAQSYYVMNNIAIYSMEAQEAITDAVREDFQTCRLAAADKATVDFWARGTLINCLLALGEDEQAAQHLVLLRREAKDPNDTETAAQHYNRILDLRPGGRRGFDWREASLGSVVHPIRTGTG